MRIKRGVNKHRRHKKVLQMAKGYRMSYSTLYKRAHEAVMHAGQYSFDHRKKRQGQFRALWITRISAALLPHKIKYSEFIDKLNKKKIIINRKLLANLALNKLNIFNDIVKQVV